MKLGTLIKQNYGPIKQNSASMHKWQLRQKGDLQASSHCSPALASLPFSYTQGSELKTRAVWQKTTHVTVDAPFWAVTIVELIALIHDETNWQSRRIKLSKNNCSSKLSKEQDCYRYFHSDVEFETTLRTQVITKPHSNTAVPACRHYERALS